MRKITICLLGLALVLFMGASLLLTACGGSGDSTATTQAVTAPTETLAGGDAIAAVTYTDPDYGFSFDYPETWQLYPASEVDVNVSGGASPATQVIVGDPNGAVADGSGVDMFMTQVYELNMEVTDSLLPQVLPELQNLVTGLQTQDPSMQILEPLAPTTVGALNGYSFSATFSWTDGTRMLTTYYFVFDGAIEYSLVVQAAEENWDADQEVFDLFLSSFQP